MLTSGFLLDVSHPIKQNTKLRHGAADDAVGPGFGHGRRGPSGQGCLPGLVLPGAPLGQAPPFAVLCRLQVPAGQGRLPGADDHLGGE